MIKIGITGGIGSGKTIIAELLKVMGIPVYIADEESKRLTDSSPVIRKKLIALLGDDIYKEGKPDRSLLASYIFNRPDILKAVNAIIHPEVLLDFLNWSTRQDGKICAIESAILFESGFDKTVDIKLMVYAPVSLRIERAVQRGTLTREEVERRINNQLPDEIKREMSDKVILNDGTCALIPQVKELLSSI